MYSVVFLLLVGTSAHGSGSGVVVPAGCLGTVASSSCGGIVISGTCSAPAPVVISGSTSGGCTGSTAPVVSHPVVTLPTTTGGCLGIVSPVPVPAPAPAAPVIYRSGCAGLIVNSRTAPAAPVTYGGVILTSGGCLGTVAPSVAPSGGCLGTVTTVPAAPTVTLSGGCTGIYAPATPVTIAGGCTGAVTLTGATCIGGSVHVTPSPVRVIVPSGTIYSGCTGIIISGSGCCGGVIVPSKDKEKGKDKGGSKGKDKPDNEEVRGTDEPAPARIVVKLPENATLTVDGMATKLTSATRTFQSPPLKPGKTYAYTLKAEFMKDGEKAVITKTVEVEAGKTTNVDLTSTAVASN